MHHFGSEDSQQVAFSNQTFVWNLPDQSFLLFSQGTFQSLWTSRMNTFKFPSFHPPNPTTALCALCCGHRTLQVVARPFGFFMTSLVFTKVLTPTLGLLHPGRHLPKETSLSRPCQPVSMKCWRPCKRFVWILNYQKLVMELTHCLEYLGLILDMAQS